MKLKFRKLSTRAETPRYAHIGDACFDVKVLIDNDSRPFVFHNGAKEQLTPSFTESGHGYMHIMPCQRIVFHTGLAFEIPEGWVMKCHVRSSVGIKNGLILSNGTGIIDSGYRGELHVSLTNTCADPVVVCDGDRVVQCELCRVEQCEFEETDVLSETDRGTGGIGSTGK